MYCSECGEKACGKFCSHCGTPLAATDEKEERLPTSNDWEQCLDYALVTQAPRVRDALARAAAASPARMTGEQFLELMDKVLQPITGVPTSLIAKLAQPLNDRLGLKTGKQQCHSLNLPPGRALAAVLCALAEQGCQLVDVCQQSDRCTLRAKIPSDLFSLSGGEFEVCVIREQSGVRIAADATIKGQVFDWGKCRRRLDELFTAVRCAA